MLVKQALQSSIVYNWHNNCRTNLPLKYWNSLTQVGRLPTGRLHFKFVPQVNRRMSLVSFIGWYDNFNTLARHHLTLETFQGPFVPGKAFDRFVTIWLENTDFSSALADSMKFTSSVLGWLFIDVSS